MALGTIQLNKLNLLQGPIDEVERHMLYIGVGDGTTNVGKLLSIGPEADLDEALGTEESVLKTQVDAARLNAGQNFTATVIPLASATDWEEAVETAMETVSVEAVVVTDAITVSTQIEAFQAQTVEIMAKYMRPLFFMCAFRGCDTDETWADYVVAASDITADVAADQVMVVPYLWPMTLGALAGRLCNRAVTVADTPMRVATGPMIGEWSERPLDVNDSMLTMAHLKTLDANRLSVPQWYPDYPGTYWGDGNLLDVPAGDYQEIENLRVVQKCMRQVYPLVVGRIGDRRLNSTPASIAENKNYFLRPLRKMAKSATIMGLTFPGEIHPPTDASIEIVWLDKKTVVIYITARPYNCPKDITVNLALDLSVE